MQWSVNSDGNRRSGTGWLRRNANPRRRVRRRRGRSGNFLGPLPHAPLRARRRHRQWHAPGWFSVLAVFPSYVGRPKLPGIMAGVDPKDCIAFSAVACARFILLVILHLALFFFPYCCHAQVFRIMAGMNQRDSYVASMVQTAENCGFSAVSVHHGRRHFLRDAEAHPHGPCDHEDSPVVRGQGGRCPYYAGAHFPSWRRGSFPWSRLRRTTGIPQFFFDKTFDAPVAQVVQIFPIVVQMPIPVVQTVRRNMEIPQFVFDKMTDVPVVQDRACFSRAGRQHPCREAEAALSARVAGSPGV